MLQSLQAYLNILQLFQAYIIATIIPDISKCFIVAGVHGFSVAQVYSQLPPGRLLGRAEPRQLVRLPQQPVQLVQGGGRQELSAVRQHERGGRVPGQPHLPRGLRQEPGQ